MNFILTEPSPESAALRAMRRWMPAAYFVNAPEARVERHFALLARLKREPLIVDFYRAPGTRLTELTLLAYDEDEPGLLSKVCGTLAALRINIHSGFIYTIPEPETPGRGESERSIVLDTLVVSEWHRRGERVLGEAMQDRIRAELNRVLERRVTVTQLLARARIRLSSPIDIHAITVARQEDGLIAVRVRTADAPGVLSRTSEALATLELDTRMAHIGTENGVADDVFFVSGAHGIPVSDAMLDTIAPRLSALLQGERVPVGVG